MQQLLLLEKEKKYSIHAQRSENPFLKPAFLRWIIWVNFLQR